MSSSAPRIAPSCVFAFFKWIECGGRPGKRANTYSYKMGYSNNMLKSINAGRRFRLVNLDRSPKYYYVRIGLEYILDSIPSACLCGMRQLFTK